MLKRDLEEQNRLTERQEKRARWQKSENVEEEVLEFTQIENKCCIILIKVIKVAKTMRGLLI